MDRSAYVEAMAAVSRRMVWVGLAYDAIVVLRGCSSSQIRVLLC